MSKYTEADVLNAIKTMGLFRTSYPKYVVEKVVNNALNIANRFEQVMTDEQTADCIIVDAECVNNKHDKEVWLNGYNQALSDLRGDTE